MTHYSTLCSAPQQLKVDTFDTFLARVFQRGSAGGHITLDLRGVQFIDLFAMVALIYCCEELRESFQCRVRLEVEDTGGCSFLPRMGFYNILGKDVELPDVYTPAYLQMMNALHGVNNHLIELTPITSSQVIAGILRKLIHILHRSLHYQLRDARNLAIIFSELTHNILDHSGSTGLAAMQVYNTGPSGRFMQMVVADRGYGIKTTLQRNPEYSTVQTDIEAIMKSTQPGVSEHHDTYRGAGLYQLLQLTSQLRGSVYIRSGSGKVYLRADRGITHVFDVPYLTGAQFYVSFSENQE